DAPAARPADGALSAGALDIDVDPLVIARACREAIDPVLVDRDPVGGSELAADELRRRRHAVAGDRHGVLPHAIARRSLRRILPTFDFGNASRKRTSFGTL